MEDIINDDDSTSWGGVADGENDQFMGGIHADFLNSMATIPRALARGENMIDRSFNSSEYLDRHLMFLRKRRQGPPPGPPSSVGRPAGPEILVPLTRRGVVVRGAACELTRQAVDLLVGIAVVESR
ncbi:hypothetical protein HPB51_011450 [Rhipicephalus microplus]|uniref:Uncharacterized protein n=1 Tax=Rhipicephalus microplus TaxID=6941 RepID=A0A9J6DUN5_RHIMP|nr:hypothetical protein HPB51_011450 [Rhipicephalus microplus]